MVLFRSLSGGVSLSPGALTGRSDGGEFHVLASELDPAGFVVDFTGVVNFTHVADAVKSTENLTGDMTLSL